MTTQTEALKMALEAFKKIRNDRYSHWVVDQEIDAIEEALAQPEQPKVRTGDCLLVGVCASEGHKIQKAQPEQEPVAWMDAYQPWDLYKNKPNLEALPLYTTPPQRKPLTDEEIMNIAKVSCIGISPHEDALNFAKVIEAAHGIKE